MRSNEKHQPFERITSYLLALKAILVLVTN